MLPYEKIQSIVFLCGSLIIWETAVWASNSGLREKQFFVLLVKRLCAFVNIDRNSDTFLFMSIVPHLKNRYPFGVYLCFFMHAWLFSFLDMRCVLGKPIFLGDKKGIGLWFFEKTQDSWVFPKTYKHPPFWLVGMSICQSAFLAFGGRSWPWEVWPVFQVVKRPKNAFLSQGRKGCYF